MANQNISQTEAVAKLHPRNPHKGRYDLETLSRGFSALKTFMRQKGNGESTLDFSDPDAILALNQSLLAHFYNVNLWQIPSGYLCPPIPGRADYIHYIADLLAHTAHSDSDSDSNNVPRGKQVHVLDIGTGANCIYPIIGSKVYGWQFVGSDIDPVSVKCAQNIACSNSGLIKKVKLVLQKNPELIFEGIIGSKDLYDLTLCNPPFHSSMAQAVASNQRKQNNLSGHRQRRINKSIGRLTTQKNSAELKGDLNFGGQKAELWCSGGEIAFLQKMIKESILFADQVCWFTTLVSKIDNVQTLKKQLNKLGAKQIEVLNMSQGQKISRILAWSFLTPEQQQAWAKQRWT